MNIILPTDPFIIEFNLADVICLDKKQNIYKFSLSFLHCDNREIIFSLPKNYQTYLYTKNIIKLINSLSKRLEQLERHINEDAYLEFEKNCFVTFENDMEIIIDAGEYYSNEKNGLLHLIWFFNINVAYKHSGSSKIGFKSSVELDDIKMFVNELKRLI